MSTGNGQINFNDALAEAVLKDLSEICETFKSVTTEYPGIIDNITETGWTGQSNSNFISKSGEYINNLGIVCQSIVDFREDFSKKYFEARKALEW